MIFKRSIIIILILGLLGCTSGTDRTKSDELIIFAAASLTDAFNELALAFQAQNDGLEIILNFGGSSQLAAQLREGVPADVFASANPAQMEAVVRFGLVETANQKRFVSNQLTVIVPADNPAGITTFEDLARPGVQLILAVEGVPVRQYTNEIVAGMPAEFQTQFYKNLVSEEDNVRQVLAKIALGEADAGLVYTSDVTPGITDSVQQIPIPNEQNISANYPIALLTNAPSPTIGQKFIDFVLSKEGQMILSRWGFGPPTVN